MVKQLGIGLVIGVLLGFVAMKVFANLPASVGSFAPVASVSVAALSYGVADVLGGSGFLAVYIVGLAVGSTPSQHRGHLVAFHEGLAFLAQVTMFVVLGLLVFPSDLPEVMVSGLRPRAAPRRRHPPARRLGIDGVQRLHAIASARFSAGPACAVPCQLSSARSSSPSMSTTARRSSTPSSSSSSCLRSCRGRRSSGSRHGSGWSTLRPPVVAKPLSVDEAGPLDLIEFEVSGGDAIAGSAVRELGLPRSALVAVIARGKHTIPPRGSTVIEPGDRLYVLIPQGTRGAIDDVFSRWRRRV